MAAQPKLLYFFGWSKLAEPYKLLKISIMLTACQEYMTRKRIFGI